LFRIFRRTVRVLFGAGNLGQRIVAVAFVGDLLMILTGLLLSFYIRFLTPIREWGIYARPAVADYLGYIILASVVYSGMLYYGGVYDHRNLLKLRLVTAPILKWSIAWIGLILLVSFMLKFEPPVSRVYCVIAWVITPSILVSWRGLFQLLLIRTSALSALRQRVVFVGWNQHSAHLARNFMHSPSSGYQVVATFMAMPMSEAKSPFPTWVLLKKQNALFLRSRSIS